MGDTLRYTLMPAGIPAGERSVWLEAPDVRHHRLSYRGASLESRIELDSAGLPRRLETTGVLPNGLAWEERFERHDDSATWSTPDERDTRAVGGPAYYVSPAYEAAFGLSLLAPALLARADRSLPLLPEGTARLEPLGRRVVEVEAEGRSREIRHFAVHGLDLAPEYVWLDEDGRLFADEVSILAGWEPVFPELLAASREALIRHGRSLFADLIPPVRERPLVIRGARLFDAESRSIRQGMTIVVRDNRIAAVGPDDSVEVPDSADMIDGAGRTALPGLWDMHVHTTSDLDEELEAPLYIAGGVTTVRDLGSATDVLASLRRRGDDAEAIAPRILPALIMYGPGGRVLGVSVDTPEEAREAIDRFAERGYVQIKLRQPSVRPELVPVIVERARRHGMRVSGHVLDGMTGREAIESGYDEIQHMLYVRVGAAGIRSLASEENIGARLAAVRPGTDQWRDFVRLLLDHDVVVDPTLAVVEESVGERPPVWLERALDRFPPQPGRMARYDAGPPAPPPPLREHWDEIVANGPDMLRALHEAGVPLVAGTDADFGGFPLHRELEVYVEAGIPAPEVLALATLGAARVMGMDDELGTIEPGKLADLILVEGDPAADISDIRRVVTVIKDGRVYDPAAIYRALGIEPCCAPDASYESRFVGASTRTIDVDGHPVRILSRGLDRSGAGPMIVFEGGSTTPLEAWSGVLAELDDDVPFLAYDPPGIGGSEWDGVRPAPERVAGRLRSVLREAEARPPYVLVGPSWAGWVVRAFEGRYPEDVAAMVLIDPTPPVSEFMAALAEIGAGEQGLAEFARLGERLTAGAPEPVRARQRVISDYLESRSDPAVPKATSTPVAVLVAGRYDSTEVPEALRPAFDVQAFFQALQRRKTIVPLDWVSASPNATIVHAADSPHCIHCTDPGLVAAAIRRAVDAAEARSAAPAPDTVHVAPPTGERDTDRASILAALERVEPGGTVQFAPGTYVVGRFIDVAVPRITLAGHPEGTTIRGCDPAAFDAMERDDAVVECNGFNLTGGHQTVRDLTFEHAWHTLALGDYTPGPSRAEAEQAPVESRPGGYVVERNTFRWTQNGIRLTGQWSEPAVIRDNRFIDTYHAVVINGMTAHVIDNEISVPEPERVPRDHRPGTPLYVGGWAEVGMPACDGNVIAGNRIEGHPDGIVIAPFPGGVCRHNEIRDNTIRVARIRFTGPSSGIHVRSPSDSVLVGVPIALLNGVFGDGVIEDTRIEGNEVLGASGVAIEILGATGNRVANNLIRDVEPRDPFPGNTLFPEPPRWRDANGAGIWISPGSDDDEIVGNRFANVAGDTIVVEGEGDRGEGDGDRVGSAAAPSDTLEALPDDTPYLWLEDLDADTVLAWAESRTERTVEGLASGPVHDSLVAEIRAARQASRFVIEPGVRPPVLRTGTYVNRFPGGRAWMRQPAEAHDRGADEWQRVLDLDSLSRAEGGRLAPESVECLPPAYERCLLRLARDGRQRIVDLREFDAGRKAFVTDGFELREAQTSAFWRDDGSLYVTTKPMGWAHRALVWRRGEPLDGAEVLFTADPGDRGLKFERRGNRLLLLHARHQYDIDYYLVGEGDELAHLPVPGDVRELAFVDGRMILQLRSGWTPAGEAFPSGSLIAIDLDDFLAGDREFQLVMASDRDLVVDEIWTTRSLVIVRALADLEIRLFEFAHRDGRWDRRQIDVPGSGRVEVQNSSHESDTYYFTHEDFLEPRTAYVRSASGDVEIGGRSRPAFSADGYEVRRYHATSADGTRVPYFVVHPEDMPRDGSTPLIVSGYGGNGVSRLPRYLSLYGPTWLARGGAYVLANIRGGNEYGFEWHDAVRRENRQRAFDDFQAVARDLVDRKITSPGRIGTASGSNGGILVGISFIQRPELYGAVVGFNGVFELHRCSQLSGDPPVGERGNGQDPDDWAYMRHYSPFHNLRGGEPYPAVLMLANRADDIVHPCHSRKFTAKLEDLGYEDVFYYETGTGGHAKGYEPEEEAMIVGFFLRYLRPE